MRYTRVLVICSLILMTFRPWGTACGQEPDLVAPAQSAQTGEEPLISALRAGPEREPIAVTADAASRPQTIATTAITPAADISAGTFGGNTGGGNYAFTGNTGFGTTAPAGLVHIANGPFFYEANLDQWNSYGFTLQKSRGTPAARTIISNADSTGFIQFQGWDGAAYRQNAIMRAVVEDTPAAGSIAGALTFGTTTQGATLSVERMRISSTGNVGIGTASPTAKLHVVGNLVVTGDVTGARVFNAVYQDLAEWVPAAENLEPGTVVVLDRTHNNQVTSSGLPYDTSVAGVVSVQPGVLLGVPGENKETIATTGRVRVRVDARSAPIAIGDLLVTGSRPGTAMKSHPLDLGGVAIHRPGTIIGKALEALPAGEGEILVLLSLQ